MNKALLIGGAVGAVALVLLAGSAHASPGPGPGPDGPPMSWRRMLDSELVPSETDYAVAMLNDRTLGSIVTHDTANGWRQWRREGRGVTVWRPASDPYPNAGGGGGLPSGGGGGGDTKPQQQPGGGDGE